MSDRNTNGRSVEEARPFMEDNVDRYGGVELPSVAERQYTPDSAPIKYTTIVIAALLCFATALERMTFYSMQVNLVRIVDIYINNGTSLVYFFATSHFLPYFGGCVGENFVGEYRGSVLGIGLELLASLIFLSWLPDILKVNNATTSSVGVQTAVFTLGNKVVLIIGLIFMTVGVSFSRTNLMILTCKQFPENRLVDISFFLLYYWSINMGSLLGYTMAGTGNDAMILVMWSVPLFIALVLLFIARKVPGFEVGKPSTLASKVALKSLRSFLRASKPLPDNSMINSVTAAAVLRRDGKEKRLGKHLAALFVLMAIHIVFEAVYSIDGIWIEMQQLDWEQSLTILGYDFQWLVGVYDPLAVIIIAPLTFFIFLPISRRCCPWLLDQLRLMGFGMVCLSLSCIIAASNEFTRSIEPGHPVLNSTYQIPQFLILALAEICTYVVAYEFIYFETPKGLRNSMISLYWSSIGLGMYLAYALIWILDKFHVNGQPRTARSYLGFFLVALALLQLFTLVPYALMARKYKYKINYTENVDDAITEARRQRYTFGSTFMESCDSADLTPW